jgi:RND family efflux transporter MFP subunit
MDDAALPSDSSYAAQHEGNSTTPSTANVKWGLVAAGIFAAGILGFVLLQLLASEPVQVARESRAPLVQVAPITIQNSALKVQGDGPVRPRAQVTVLAQVSGEIIETSEALVTGGRFKAGDTLLQIDPRSYRAALDQAKADRAARQADLDFAERQLAQSGAASERRRDETLNQHDRALAQIAGLEALIAMREVDLQRATVTAPFDGQVFTENVDAGSIVQPGVEMAKIFATDMFEIVVPLSDREAALIPGLWDDTLATRPRATATLSYRNQVYAWDGYVDRVEAGIDPDTRTIDVVVRIPTPLQRGRLVTVQNEGSEQSVTLGGAPPLLSGTYAAIEIEGLTLSHAILPRAALRNNNTIWLVTGEETLSVITVDVLQDQGTHVAIRSTALKTGDRVVVSDLDTATDGLSVQIADNGSTGP